MSRLSFWSLGRSGLFPVSGRPSFRALRCAVASCGLPRPFVRRGSRLVPGSPSWWWEAGLSFSSGGLFRCWFLVRLSSVRAGRPPRL